MYCTRKVNEDYTWIGADGRRLAMFEGVFDVPEGISFNSYLLKDEKTVLFDTADASVARQFRENLLHELDGRTLDYVVVHHMEPDHSAELENLVVRYPNVKIVCSAMAKTMVGQYFGHGYDERIQVVKEGDTLCTGKHTLQFVAAPMVHWPEVIMTYDITNKFLLSADAFGTFGALNGHLFSDEVNFDRDYVDECRRYYANIVGKYGDQVMAVLKKAGSLDIRMILPLHGFVWRKDIGYILDKHVHWASYEPEVRGVMIAYASVYGNTESTANVLACRLAEKGVPVTVRDTSMIPLSKVVSDAFKYSHIVLASTTYNMGVFIFMEELLHDLVAHSLKNRTYMTIENGSWAPAASKGMDKILEPLGWRKMEDNLTIKSAIREDQLVQLERMADMLAQDIANSAANAEAAAAGAAKKQFVCKICGYVYEGEELSADYRCPLCGASAEYFAEK